MISYLLEKQKPRLFLSSVAQFLYERVARAFVFLLGVLLKSDVLFLLVYVLEFPKLLVCDNVFHLLRHFSDEANLLQRV